MTDKKTLAYHEAGHALMCYILGNPFTLVTILPCKYSDTACIVQRRVSPKLSNELDWANNERTDRYHEYQAFISLAGPEAVKQICGKSTAFSYKKDHDEAAYHVRRSIGRGEAGKYFMKFLEVSTRDVLKHKRKLLHKIAKELLKRNSLSYKDVKKLLAPIEPGWQIQYEPLDDSGTEKDDDVVSENKNTKKV